jgi:hypothetical protein
VRRPVIFAKLCGMHERRFKGSPPPMFSDGGAAGVA